MWSDSERKFLLRTAVSFGKQLTTQAVWNGNTCKWKGKTKGISSNIGFDLYSGTSGVSLFLAQLYAVVDDIDFRDTSLGAIRYALAFADQKNINIHSGAYVGLPGVALAAARVGILVGDEDVLRRARDLMKNIVRSISSSPRTFDIISGTAGDICIALTLYRIYGESSFLDWATSLGDDLLVSAEKEAGVYSWRHFDQPFRRNLTGYSHGASGAAHALLELYQVIGCSRFKMGANAAFSYERFHFDEDKQNWPDFRGSGLFRTYWCHGAPGIAVSRLRAYQITGDNCFLAEARVAVTTTLQSTQARIRTGSFDNSLCHGASGNALVLKIAADTCVEFNTQDSCDVIRETALFVYRNCNETAIGSSEEMAPGLMLGLAGIGYFYLSLYVNAINTNIPSVLCIAPDWSVTSKSYCISNSIKT